MTCPACFSTRLRGPFYGGGARRIAILRCDGCSALFDAYQWFGTGR